jgi:hypothetical protein
VGWSARASSRGNGWRRRRWPSTRARRRPESSWRGIRR